MCEEYTGSKKHTILLIKKLEKLYLCKCGQVEQARLSSNQFRCQVLMAEAEAIRTELEHYG